MQAESLEVLERADLAPGQARAIVRAIEIELDRAKDTLTTKQDLNQLRGELKGDLLALAAQLRIEMYDLGSHITRAMYMAMLGQMVVLLGFSYFFATHMR